MALADLLALLLRSPDTLLLLLALANCVCVALGGIGTALEEFGAKAGHPRIERFGQRLEAVFADLPKLWRGSRAPLRATQAKDSSAAVAPNSPPPPPKRWNDL